MLNNIKFYIPGLFTSVTLNMNLLNLISEKPECFKDDVKIESIYGSFPCIWNGDSVNFGDYTNRDIISAVNTLNQNGQSLSYTFNNSFIDDDYAKDTEGNQILKTTSDHQTIKTNIILKSKSLEKKIADNYDEFNIIYDERFFNEDFSLEKVKTNNNYFVLIEDVSLIDKLVLDGINPNKIILAINDPADAENYVKKQMFDSFSWLNLKEDFDSFEPQSKSEALEDYYGVYANRSSFMDFEKIEKIFKEKKISNFLISNSNANPLFVVENYINLFVKDEYKNEIRYLLLEPYFRTQY